MVLLKSRWPQIRSAAVSFFCKHQLSSFDNGPVMALQPLPEERPSDFRRLSWPE
jgi:hypothetical protein